MKRMLALAMTLLLSGLSLSIRAQVSNDYDHSVDFSQFHTYAFVTPDVNVPNPLYNSPLLLANIKGNLSRELGTRGLTQQLTNPDLLVKIHTYTENKARTIYGGAYSPFFPYYGGWGRFGYLPYWGGYYGGWSQPYQQQYTQGTLLVDMIDARTNQLVWRGAVQGVVDRPNRLERQVARGVHKLMKEYPVKAA